MSGSPPGGGQPPGLSLADVARLVDGRVEGDQDFRITGVGPVDEAQPDHLAFLALKRYARFAPDSAARAFLVSEELRGLVPDARSCVVVARPYPALRALLTVLHPEETAQPEVHRTAVIGRGVTLGRSVRIGPYVVLEDDVTIGDATSIGAHSVICRSSVLGPRCHLHPHVVVYPASVIGADVILHSGARIGSDGFGYTFVDGAHLKMPQVGRAVIEDGVEIGANTTVDRGSLGDTLVGAGSKIDNLVHIAHNVRIGALSLLAALSGVAGSSRLGKRTWLGGKAGVINQIEVGDDARVAVGSLVTRNVAPGDTVSGSPARPHREELRRQASLGRLAQLTERVERLEAEIERRSDPAS